MANTSFKTFQVEAVCVSGSGCWHPKKGTFAAGFNKEVDSDPAAALVKRHKATGLNPETGSLSRQTTATAQFLQR
jgi:hypothetical protein